MKAFPVLINTLALTGVLVVNALANILPINGLNTGEVSAMYPSLFTPVGLTFSIWSIIYLLLIGFIVFQWIRLNDSRIQQIVQSISVVFVISCILNMSWIVAWHFLQVWLSVVIMLGLLTTLIFIFRSLQRQTLTSIAERSFIGLPFTIYFSWICVATIANISAGLVDMQWDGAGFSESTWTIIMMLVATTLAAFITVRHTLPAFSAVVIWALIGIFLRWKGSEYMLVEYAALILTLLLSGVFIVALRKAKVS